MRVADAEPITEGKQPFDDGIVFVESRQLALDVLAALREGVDLCEQLEQAVMQQGGDGALLDR